MAVTSSGEIKLNADVNVEINGSTGTDVSLSSLSVGAGFSEPHGLTEFYGYVSALAPSVTTNSATSVGATAMTANGNVTSDGGSAITERGFYFGTNSSAATSNTKYTVTGTTGAFSRSFTGLTSGTTYYFWAYATNAVGTTIGSRITQATVVQPSFRTSEHYVVSPNSNNYVQRYYKNTSGSWVFITTINQGNTPCVNSEVTGLQNRSAAFNGDNTYSTEHLVFKIAQGGCNAISISGLTGSGGQVNNRTDYIQLRGYITANMYWYAS